MKRGATPAPEWLAWLAQVQEQADEVGTFDPFHAFRAGYAQGGVHILQYLEKLLDQGVGIGTAIDTVRAFWQGEISEWVNTPDDPQEIIPLPRSRKIVKQHV
jgi:hypothetical protein